MPRRKKSPRKAAARDSGAAKRSASPEADFRRLTLELGLDRSKELLHETERRVAELINGK
jgi:hypothetical protein